MHIADVMHHRTAIDRSCPASWWLLPAVIIGAGFWASLIYAVIT